ncbi:MAG: hypothetical protein WCK11_01005 [Candidatus Falkowbacteria bacterium]
MTSNTTEIKPVTCSLNQKDAIFDLNQALKAEERALESYQMIVDLLDSDAEQETISNVIEDEKRHIAMVKELISDLTGNYQEPEEALS